MDGSLLRSGIRAIHNGDVPGGNFKEKDAGWILYDSNEAQGSLNWDSSSFRPWKMVFSTSPKLSRYKEWVKQKNAVMYVMKPWSWSEICAGAPLQTSKSPTTKELWDAYHRFGPSARIVYKSDPVEHQSDIRLALRNCRDPSILFPQSDDAWDESSNVLVVVEPATKGGVVHRNMLTGKVATPYIMNMVHEEAKHLLGLAMRRTYRHLLSHDISRGAAGIIFEDMAHHLLGGTASCTRSLRTLPRDGSFTISPDHPVKVKGFESVQTLSAEQPINREWMLTFVVPTAVEPDFKRQPLQPVSSRGTWDQNVDQYVMGLTLEELFPTDIDATKVGASDEYSQPDEVASPADKKGKGLPKASKKRERSEDADVDAAEQPPPSGKKPKRTSATGLQTLEGTRKLPKPLDTHEGPSTGRRKGTSRK
ncbi:hypothetical protein SCP_1701720 [Sparassis crispa]|uniref:Uncharacterized protein n=1 Tax=Sparassis crispa TaxID=139825 RepID=A0A401H5X9_9APHY|nr:hypothetical protein SCP_1701720 [Sparassis crispa]GBE89847.1 hypothetical protein SCP_1701720 [Sparassis crispa]